MSCLYYELTFVNTHKLMESSSSYRSSHDSIYSDTNWPISHYNLKCRSRGNSFLERIKPLSKRSSKISLDAKIIVEKRKTDPDYSIFYARGH